MTIRIEYQPSTQHADAVRRIDAECFSQEPMDPQGLADAMRQDFWVAWRDGALAGYAYLLRRPDLSWLSRIGTAAGHRHQGVATSLMTAALQHCHRIGLPETVLYVQADNPDAIGLYERFGFRAVESTWQFVLSDPLVRLEGDDTEGMLAVPIGEVPALCLPSFPREWANIAGMHRPPEMYVLVFREGAESVGYCRLNPHFPGCFPFVLAEPSRRLVPSLRSMKGYLRSEQPILKLTIWEPRLAEACRAAGLELNYELLKMHRAGERLGPPSAGA